MIALKAGQRVMGILIFPSYKLIFSESFLRHNGWKGALVNKILAEAIKNGLFVTVVWAWLTERSGSALYGQTQKKIVERLTMELCIDFSVEETATMRSLAIQRRKISPISPNQHQGSLSNRHVDLVVEVPVHVWTIFFDFEQMQMHFRQDNGA